MIITITILIIYVNDCKCVFYVHVILNYMWFVLSSATTKSMLQQE